MRGTLENKILMVNYFNKQIILDENGSMVKKDKSKGLSQASVPAQDYEKDIFPRYKEALSLGLSSCKNLLQNTKQSKGSVLRVYFCSTFYILSFYFTAYNLLYLYLYRFLKNYEGYVSKEPSSIYHWL